MELVGEFVGRFTVHPSERQVQKERGGRQAERVVCRVGTEQKRRGAEGRAVREAFRVALRRELQDHGRFAFAGRGVPEAEDGGGGVEHAARRRRRHTVDVAFDLRLEERQLHRVAEPETQDELVEGIVLLNGSGCCGKGLLQQAHRDAPSLFGRCIATGLGEHLDAPGPLEPVDVRQQELAAPDGGHFAAVDHFRPVTGAVEGHADDGLQVVVLRHTAEGVGVVVLDLQNRDAHLFAEFLRHFGGVVQRVLVADDDARLDLQQIATAAHRFFQRFHRPQVRHVPDVGARVKEGAFGEAEGVFEFAADAE